MWTIGRPRAWMGWAVWSSSSNVMYVACHCMDSQCQEHAVHALRQAASGDHNQEIPCWHAASMTDADSCRAQGSAGWGWLLRWWIMAHPMAACSMQVPQGLCMCVCVCPDNLYVREHSVLSCLILWLLAVHNTKHAKHVHAFVIANDTRKCAVPSYLVCPM